MNYRVTEAGKQVERILEQGYADAALLLYTDAIQYDIELVVGEDSAAWHRDIQERTGWKAEAESLNQFADALHAAGDAAGRVPGEQR